MRVAGRVNRGRTEFWKTRTKSVPDHLTGRYHKNGSFGASVLEKMKKKHREEQKKRYPSGGNTADNPAPPSVLWDPVGHGPSQEIKEGKAAIAIRVLAGEQGEKISDELRDWGFLSKNLNTEKRIVFEDDVKIARKQGYIMSALAFVMFSGLFFL